jgi:hypothetical protein
MLDGSARRYADMLRRIGARIDARGYQDLVLCEVVDGFIASASPSAGAMPEGLAFSFDELTGMAPASPSAGDETITYDQLLGALGAELDRVRACMVTILELPVGLLVNFYPYGYQLEGCYGTRHELVYQPSGLRELLAAS